MKTKYKHLFMFSVMCLVIFSVVSLVWIAAWPPTAAAETYRWVDEHGGIHYGDRPPQHTETTVIDHSAAEKAEQRARQQTPPGLPVELQRRLDEIEVRTLEHSVAERQAQRQRQREQKRQTACRHLLADLKAIDTPRARIYRETENGSNEYLNHEQRATMRQELLAAIDRLDCR